MRGNNQGTKSRRYLYAFFFIVCVAALLQFAADTRAQDPPPDESLRTYDIPSVSAASFDGDVRDLTPVPINLEQRAIDFESHLQELETPIGSPERISLQQRRERAAAAALAMALAAPAPAPIRNFAGLGRFDAVTGGQAGAGTPPDPNGDVGPNHYIIAVNDAYGIYDKATGTRLAAFTENSLFSSGSRAGGGTGTGTLCDTNTFGDPVVLYDQLADRWILTNLAFVLNASGLWDPPIYQCFAASKSGDPVAGGWWVYAVRIDTGGTGLPPVGTLDDYPKFGSWNDGCLYMGANAFNSSGSSSGAIFGSFNKSDMYNGLTLRGGLGVSGSIGTSLFPANLLGRAPNQMPPPGTLDYFVRNSSTTAFQVRKFTPGANCGGGGTMGSATTVAHASSGSVGSNIVPQPNTTTTLDSLGDRIMQKVQYRKIGANESVWVIHTARPTSGSNTRPQWAQIDVTGGTIVAAVVQQAIHAPDTTLYRWMGALAVDTVGDMALGYSTSNGTAPNFPAIAYAGRLVDDPLNTLPQTETQLIAGGGSQIFNCGGGPCHRWGDYSSMSVDPVDDCTFWYTNEYYETQAQGSNQPGIWQTRIGSFKFPSCVPIYPIITCPGNITVNNDTDVCGAAVNFTGANAATATGNPPPVITYSPPSGTVFPVGTTTVTATATNQFGTDSCTFTVTVIDNQPPTIVCPPNITVTLPFGQDEAIVDPGTPTVTDNCPGATYAGVRDDGRPLTDPYPVGVTTITWTATDASLLTASCNQTITVNCPTCLSPVQASPYPITNCSGPDVKAAGATTINLPTKDVVLQCALVELSGTNGIKINAHSIKVDGPSGGSITTNGKTGTLLTAGTASGSTCDAGATIDVESASLHDNNVNGVLRMTACGNIVINSSTVVAKANVEATSTKGKICSSGSTLLGGNSLGGNQVLLSASGPAASGAGDVDVIGTSVQTAGPRDTINLTSTNGSVFAGAPAGCLPNSFQSNSNDATLLVTAKGVVSLENACAKIATNATVTAAGAGKTCSTDTIIDVRGAVVRNDSGKHGFITMTACGGTGRINIDNAILVDSGASGGGTDPNAVANLNGGKKTDPSAPLCSQSPACGGPVNPITQPVSADHADRILHHVIGVPRCDS